MGGREWGLTFTLFTISLRGKPNRLRKDFRACWLILLRITSLGFFIRYGAQRLKCIQEREFTNLGAFWGAPMGA